jgi:hypothetical protein
VQKCKSERSSCAKVERWDQSTDYGVQSTEGWQAVGGCTANGRDAVAPLPEGGAREIGQHVVLSLPDTGVGSCAGVKGAFTEGMLGVIQLARVVTGSVLIIVGLIAIPLPLTPGLPLIILGASIGLTWHPKGLRLWRRWRVKAGRKWQGWRGRRARGVG